MTDEVRPEVGDAHAAQREAGNTVRAEGVASVARKAAELRRLELVVTRRLDGLLRGEFLGRQSGSGSEVAGARSYEAGDDSRWIDWNLTARSITPQIRTTEADRELQTWTVVDRSASMSFGTGEREKSEVAFAAAAAFGFLTARHGNRFGLLVAGGDTILRLGPSSTRPELLATLSRLYDVPRRTTGSAPDADLVATLRSLERARPRRGQVIVISDFLDHTEWRAAVARLAHAHQVLCVQVVDPREITLPAAGMLTLVDTETGRSINVQSNSVSLRRRYAEAARVRHEAIARQIRDAGSEHLVLTTNSDWLMEIVRFVASRRTLRRHTSLQQQQRVRATRLRSVQ
jgi:uncharacterized protein (DUF58 family)